MFDWITHMIYHQMRDNFIDVVVGNGQARGDVVVVAKYWAENNYVGGNVRWEDLGKDTQAEWVRITELMLDGR